MKISRQFKRALEAELRRLMERSPDQTLGMALNYINQAAIEFQRGDFDTAKGHIDAAHKWGKSWERETGNKLPGKWLQLLRGAAYADSDRAGKRVAQQAADILQGILKG